MKEINQGMLFGVLMGTCILLGCLISTIYDISDLYKEKLRLEIHQLKNPKQHEKE